MMNPRISLLLEHSIGVIRSCCLENGAIIASPPRHRSPKVKDYTFAWPRDGAFTCISAHLLGVRDIQENFFTWCLSAEGWVETGLFYKKYYPDGRKARQSLQVDQNALVLMAIHDFYGDRNKVKLPAQFQHLLTKTADALCQIWTGTHFSVPYQEVWEQRYCFPDLEENFSYSLAACIHGLRCAVEMLPEFPSAHLWIKTAEQMKRVLLASPGDRFYRSFGKMHDTNPDASLLGLVWPFGIVSATDPRMLRTVEQIESVLVQNYGVHRFEHDNYDGWMYGELQRKKGSGYWPLLSLWMALYQIEHGNRENALRYYEKVLRDIPMQGDIPEQVFDNPYQKSVSPLCWAHVLFVIVTMKLYPESYPGVRTS